MRDPADGQPQRHEQRHKKIHGADTGVGPFFGLPLGEPLRHRHTERNDDDGGHDPEKHRHQKHGQRPAAAVFREPVHPGIREIRLFPDQHQDPAARDHTDQQREDLDGIHEAARAVHDPQDAAGLPVAVLHLLLKLCHIDRLRRRAESEKYRVDDHHQDQEKYRGQNTVHKETPKLLSYIS